MERINKRIMGAKFDFNELTSGSIDYRELNQIMRRQVVLDEKLRAGAAGEIETTDGKDSLSVADLEVLLDNGPDHTDLHTGELPGGGSDWCWMLLG